MKIKSKMMFLGIKELKSKEDKIYHTIGLLDLDSQETFVLFVNDNQLQKFKDYKLYQSYEFELSLSVGKNNFLRLRIL